MNFKNKSSLYKIALAGLAAGAILTACEKSESSTGTDGVNTKVDETQFKTDCETKGGTLEPIASCTGTGSCAGESWHAGEVIQHECTGHNTCNGWSCLIPST